MWTQMGGNMLKAAFYSMIFLGSALMIYNIYGFSRFIRDLAGRKYFGRGNKLLRLPILLLIMFFLGYVSVGIFIRPAELIHIIIAGILFGGSIFVFVMYRMLSTIVSRVTENERLEAELHAAEQSNRTKTEFLSTISHEMRTPLNVIIGLDTVAQTEPGVTGNIKEMFNRIDLSAKHLLGLINNILDMNHIEQGKLTVKNTDMSLSHAIEQVSAIAGAVADQKGLAFVCEGSESITKHYTGDEMMIKRVLLELLDNAVKYTDVPGKVELHISCAPAGENRDAFTFEVKDSGIGIEESFIPNIFDVFAREDQSSTNRFGGSGLGLAVIKNIVDLMGGRISVESKKNEGSTFRVDLTLEISSLPFVPKREQTEEVELEGKRILIVEDLPENAEIVSDLLDLEGAVTEHAINGKIGVQIFSESEPGYYDAVLMDLRMPVMDGLTATREIRKLDRADAKTIPIIALTANAFESDIKQSLDAGMNAHLAKPADADLLYNTLKKCMGAANAVSTEVNDK